PAADESAARDGDDERVQVRHVLEELRRAGSGSRHDELVVERRNEDRIPFAPDLLRDVLAALCLAVVQDDLGTVAARRVDLGLRRVRRHDDGRADAEESRYESDGLAVVPGREGDDGLDVPLLGLRLDLVVRAAELERAAPLQVLRLEEDLRARLLVELPRGED